METILDISPPIDASIAVWPGDRPYVRNVSLDMHTGANLTLSDIRTTLHVGAHADATSHCVVDGGDIASRPLNDYIGRCNVLHAAVGRAERILPRHLDQKQIDAPRVLFRTGTFPDPRRWNDDFASLSPELIDFLHDRGVEIGRAHV